MADSIVQSLFGPTPWQIQQAQNAGLAQAADKYASQDPFQRATGTLYRAGGMLAQPAAEAMGMVNPAMQEAQSRQQAMSGIDMSNGDSILRAAQGIADPRLKLQLTMLGQQRKAAEQEARNKSALELKTLSAAEKDMALAEKALRENPNLAVTEVGVKDKPGYMQRVLFDKTKPESPYQSIGEPYLSAAAARQTFNVSTGGGESKQPLAYVDEDGKVKWGTMAEARGKAPAAFDPITKQMVSAAGAEGKELGETAGKAQSTLAGMSTTVNEVKRNVKELLAHPGFSSTVGATLVPGMRFIEGTKQADFMKRLEQVQGGAFLKAYETLKGGGQITEIEGKKATDAMMRMSKSVSEKEFKLAADDFVTAVESGMNKLKMQSSLGKKQNTTPAASGNDLMSAAKAELERRSQK